MEYMLQCCVALASAIHSISLLYYGERLSRAVFIHFWYGCLGCENCQVYKYRVLQSCDNIWVTHDCM